MVKIVIVGGGFSGIAVANNLISTFKSHPEKIEITLIEKRHGFTTHNYASLRAMVDSKWAESIFISNEKLFSNNNNKNNNNKIVTGTVTMIESNKVTLEDGNVIPFDYAILAMGSTNDSKTKHVEKTEAIKEYHDIGDAIKTAKNILIIGAGAVGVEFAGEIAAVYPNKKVTLLSSNSSLIGPQYKPSLTKKLTQSLTKLNVEILFNERVLKPEGQDTILSNGMQYIATHTSVATASGKNLEADFIFLATGNQKLNTESVETGLTSNALNDKKEVKVKETLQLVDHENIFALGDIANVKGNKVGWVIMVQAPVVAKNIQALINKKKPSAIYKGQPIEMISIALGKNEGVCLTPLGVLGSWFTKGMKSKTLFLPVSYQAMNIKSPEGLW